MVENKKSLGVFLWDDADAKSIEKWPLIQSYAFEPVGKTFFTLQHKVMNKGGNSVRPVRLSSPPDGRTGAFFEIFFDRLIVVDENH